MRVGRLDGASSRCWRWQRGRCGRWGSVWVCLYYAVWQMNMNMNLTR